MEPELERDLQEIMTDAIKVHGVEMMAASARKDAALLVTAEMAGKVNTRSYLIARVLNHGTQYTATVLTVVAARCRSMARAYLENDQAPLHESILDGDDDESAGKQRAHEYLRAMIGAGDQESHKEVAQMMADSMEAMDSTQAALLAVHYVELSCTLLARVLELQEERLADALGPITEGEGDS